MTLIVTPGGEDSNSYATLAEADDYHDSRLHNAAWTAATDATKEAALIWATRTLDANFLWNGVKATEVQALAWPRYGVIDRDGYSVDSDVVPDRVKWAQSELAFLLIEADRTLTADPDANGVESVKINSMALKFKPEKMQAALAASVVVLVQAFGRFVGAGKPGGGAVLHLRRA